MDSSSAPRPRQPKASGLGGRIPALGQRPPRASPDSKQNIEPCLYTLAVDLVDGSQPQPSGPPQTAQTASKTLSLASMDLVDGPQPSPSGPPASPDS